MKLNRVDKAISFYNEGMRLLMEGQFGEAITALRISTDLDGQNSRALAALCLAAHEEGEHGLLYASIMKLLDLSDRSSAQRATAVSYYDGGFYLEAVTCALESLTICPDDALTNYILGRSYLALHMFGEAERALRRALVIAPDFAVVESLLLWLETYLSVPERERVPLLTNARRVPMHCYPLDVREMEKYPFTQDSLRDLYGEGRPGGSFK